MFEAFIQGAIAGYAIAIPVGAIGILIIDLTFRDGFRAGAIAGAGAASADIIYAILAALTGAALAVIIEPYAMPLQIISALVLFGLGGWGLWGIWRDNGDIDEEESPSITKGSRVYFQFLGLTILNPMTIAYFAALILGRGTETLNSPATRFIFVAGAGLASLSWQVFLAAMGSVAKGFFSPRFQIMTRIFGNLIVIGLGGWTLIGLL